MILYIKVYTFHCVFSPRSVFLHVYRFGFQEFLCFFRFLLKKTVRHFLLVRRKFVPLHPLSGLTRQHDKRSLSECERTRKRIGKAQYMSVRRWACRTRAGIGTKTKRILYSEEFDPGSG